MHNFRNASLFTRLMAAAVMLVMLAVGLVLLTGGNAQRPEVGVGGTATRLPTPNVGPGLAATQSLAAGPTIDNTGRLTVPEASTLITDWIFANDSRMNPASRFPLVEITTDEIWQRMKTQVFKVSDGVKLNEAYLILNGKVYPIGIAFGGNGVDSLAVTDLDGSGTPELVYTYSFGSGIRQSLLGLFDPQGKDAPPVTGTVPGFHYLGSLRLEKQNDKTLRLLGTRNADSQTERLGRLNWANHQLSIVPDDGSLKP